MIIIKWVGQNHKTKITGYIDPNKVIAWDLIDSVGEDKTIYYQIILTYEWTQWGLFYEMTKEDRTKLSELLLKTKK